MRATCPAHLVLLALITLILGEEYKPCSSSLCSFLQPPHRYQYDSKNNYRTKWIEYLENINGKNLEFGLSISKEGKNMLGMSKKRWNSFSLCNGNNLVRGIDIDVENDDYLTETE
jgi:hypothetical protein